MDATSGDGAEQPSVVVDALVASGDDPRGCEATLTSDLKARLTATRWVLVELDGTPIAPSATDLPTPSLVFYDDAGGGLDVKGFAGCNSFRAHARPQAVGASATVGTLGTSDVGTTRRACTGDRMATETSLLAVLSGAERLDLEGGTLVVTGGGHVARFQMEVR